jgi:hypothetical protein
MFDGPLVTVTSMPSLAPELAPGARRAHQPWRLSVKLFGAGVEVIHGTFSVYVRFNQKVGL